MDNNLALMCGIDLPCPQLQLTFHQPTIKEIALMGETNFFTAVQCLLINKKLISVQGNLSLESLSNFHIFMMILEEEKDKKEDVKHLLSLIFPNHSSTFVPKRTLILKSDDSSVIIDESNFEILQEQARVFLSPSMKDGADGQGFFNPKGSKAEEIARKLMRGRERVAAQKGGNNGSALTQYLSVLAVGMNSMSLEELSNLTLYQFFDLLERYMLYINWDIDIRARMAGAKNDKPMENWMKSLR